MPNRTNHLTTPLPELGVRGGQSFRWKQFVAISSTCRFWQGVLHEHLRVVPFPDGRSDEILNNLLKFMKEKVAMVYTPSSRPRRPNYLDLRPRRQDILLVFNLKRIRVLTIEQEFDQRDTSESFCYIAPVLESFTLTGKSDSPPYRITRLFGNDAPKLREITLARCYLSATSPLLAQLTHLSLSYLQRAPEDAVYGTLRAARNLASLKLVYGLPSIDESPKGEAPIVFPHLRRLHICCAQDGLGSVMRFFWHLRAPLDLEIGLSWDQVNLREDVMNVARVDLNDALKAWRQRMSAGEEIMIV
ncbi:hypothetical protein HGRIS_000813 [Hohenbuehelia grisea]|uniref:Uncharacterized protein n=1 Tax=Hohenbuehelia grisea TaxID=104357 RepID=A0ABR3IPT6_9AGAR